MLLWIKGFAILLAVTFFGLLAYHSPEQRPFLRDFTGTYHGFAWSDDGGTAEEMIVSVSRDLFVLQNAKRDGMTSAGFDTSLLVPLTYKELASSLPENPLRRGMVGFKNGPVTMYYLFARHSMRKGYGLVILDHNGKTLATLFNQRQIVRGDLEKAARDLEDTKGPGTLVRFQTNIPALFAHK